MTTLVNFRHEPCDMVIRRPSKRGNAIPIHGLVPRAKDIAMNEVWIRRRPDFHAAQPKVADERLDCRSKPLPFHGDKLIRQFINVI